MPAEPLTTLESVKNWLSIGDDTRDDKLSSLLDPASRLVRQFLGYDPTKTTYIDDAYDGNGATQLFLRSRPILTVASLYITDVSPTTPIAATQARSTVAGYWFDATTLYLRGYRFPMGRQNIFVTYDAGYDVIPSEIETATNMTIQALDSAGSIDVNVVTENVPGAYSATFRPDAGKLPANAVALLAPLRRVSL